MIKERMRELGITQKELADKLGITRRSIINKLQRKTLFKQTELRKLKRILWSGVKIKITNDTIWGAENER
jgi:transcriptional regulator with XRE-family HTH domain